MLLLQQSGYTLLSIGVSTEDATTPLMWEFSVAGDTLAYYFTDYNNKPLDEYFVPLALCKA